MRLRVAPFPHQHIIARKRGWVRLERGGVTILALDKLVAIAEEGSEFDPS